MQGYWKEDKKQTYQSFVDLCIKLYVKRVGRSPIIGYCHKSFQPVGIEFVAKDLNVNELLLGE